MSKKFKKWMIFGMLIGFPAYGGAEYLECVRHTCHAFDLWIIGVKVLLLYIGTVGLDVAFDIAVTDKEKKEGEVD